MRSDQKWDDKHGMRFIYWAIQKANLLIEVLTMNVVLYLNVIISYVWQSRSQMVKMKKKRFFLRKWESHSLIYLIKK